MAESKCRCSALWDSWELCVFRFSSPHSCHSKIFNTREYSCRFNSLPLVRFCPPVFLSISPAKSLHYMHFAFYTETLRNISYLFIFVYVCVFVYFNKIFARHERQAQRTLNGGCFIVCVCAVAQCKSNEYILLKFYASVNVLFAWRWYAASHSATFCIAFCCMTAEYMCDENFQHSRRVHFSRFVGGYTFAFKEMKNIERKQKWKFIYPLAVAYKMDFLTRMEQTERVGGQSPKSDNFCLWHISNEKFCQQPSLHALMYTFVYTHVFMWCNSM